MASDRQIEANRRNSLKSTGPKTETGKSASRFNAIKHALSAKTLLLPGEDHNQYAALLEEFMQAYEPEDVTEEVLVIEAVEAWWLHQRARAVMDTYMQFTRGHAQQITEKAQSGISIPPLQALAGDLMTTDASGVRDYTNLFRYLTHTERTYHRAMQNLLRLRGLRIRERSLALREARSNPQPKPSARKPVGFVPQPEATEAKPKTAAKIGFVSQYAPQSHNTAPPAHPPIQNDERSAAASLML